MKKTRIETVRETSTLLILKKSDMGAQQGWCEHCAAEVFWIAPTAIGLFGISEEPTAAVHKNGDFVCSRSLIEEIKKGEKR